MHRREVNATMHNSAAPHTSTKSRRWRSEIPRGWTELQAGALLTPLRRYKASLDKQALIIGNEKLGKVNFTA
jgi:hypothetical protein